MVFGLTSGLLTELLRDTDVATDLSGVASSLNRGGGGARNGDLS